MIQLMLTYLRIPATKLYSLLIPVLLKADTPYEAEEGCLSLVGVRKTTRYQNIEVEYTDKNWNKKRIKLSGWYAQICQHELDHLEGIII